MLAARWTLVCWAVCVGGGGGGWCDREYRRWCGCGWQYQRGVVDLTWGPWICPFIGRKGSARKPCPICNFKGQIPQVKSTTV